MNIVRRRTFTTEYELVARDVREDLQCIIFQTLVDDSYKEPFNRYNYEYMTDEELEEMKNEGYINF